MSKTLKIWLWVLIVLSSLSVVGEFIFVNGIIGFFYACLSVAAIFAFVQIFKQNIAGAYAFLIIRVIESAMTLIFSGVLIKNSVKLIELLSNAGMSYVVLGIILVVIRLISPVVTLIWCKKA